MSGEGARKVEVIHAVRCLAAILYRLRRAEAALRARETAENDAALPSGVAPLEALSLCAMARKQMLTVEKILECR